MKDLALATLLILFVAFTVWLDNHPPQIPNLMPYIDPVMEWLAPK